MAYDENYLEEIFYAWYEGGRSLSIVPKDKSGSSPSKKTIEMWARDNDWNQRADILDAQVSKALDEKVIQRRAVMFEEHVKLADQLIEKGMKFLNEEGITSDNSAIRAITLGIETQRVSVGVAEAFAKISAMSNEQLEKELLKLTGRDKAIDGEVVENEENKE